MGDEIAEGECPICDVTLKIKIGDRRTRHDCTSCHNGFFFSPDTMDAKPTRPVWALTDKGYESLGMTPPPRERKP